MNRSEFKVLQEKSLSHEARVLYLFYLKPLSVKAELILDLQMLSEKMSCTSAVFPNEEMGLTTMAALVEELFQHRLLVPNVSNANRPFQQNVVDNSNIDYGYQIALTHPQHFDPATAQNLVSRWNLVSVELPLAAEPVTFNGDYKFRMHDGWEPSASFRSIAIQAGLIDYSFNEQELFAFISYWAEQNTTHSQEGWERVFVKRLIRLHYASASPERRTTSFYDSMDKGRAPEGTSNQNYYHQYHTSPYPQQSQYLSNTDPQFSQPYQAPYQESNPYAVPSHNASYGNPANQSKQLNQYNQNSQNSWQAHQEANFINAAPNGLIAQSKDQPMTQPMAQPWAQNNGQANDQNMAQPMGHASFHNMAPYTGQPLGQNGTNYQGAAPNPYNNERYAKSIYNRTYGDETHCEYGINPYDEEPRSKPTNLIGVPLTKESIERRKRQSEANANRVNDGKSFYDESPIQGLSRSYGDANACLGSDIPQSRPQPAGSLQKLHQVQQGQPIQPSQTAQLSGTAGLAAAMAATFASDAKQSTLQASGPAAYGNGQQNESCSEANAASAVNALNAMGNIPALGAERASESTVSTAPQRNYSFAAIYGGTKEVETEAKETWQIEHDAEGNEVYGTHDAALNMEDHFANATREAEIQEMESLNARDDELDATAVSAAIDELFKKDS